VLERLITNFKNIFNIPELRNRILFTLGMLTVYRFGAYIPTPGINNDELAKFLLEKGGALLGFLDIFSGGALSRLTIFALGIMPYISASIILQLLTVVIPHLTKLAKEGERGRKKIVQYTRFGTIGIGLIQSFGIAIGLEGMNRGAFVQAPGWSFRLMTMLTLTAGTAFLMWLGEQITERGIGNGISLIIFAGIVARLPAAVTETYQLFDVGQLTGFWLITLIGGQSTHIPLKINTAGVIPPIFASSIIAFPATIAGFIQIPWVQQAGTMLAPGSVTYTILYVSMIVFFCYFYTAVVLNPVDIADNMKKYGGFIPGIRPGQRTSDYIYRVLNRITFAGSLYLAAVCIIPEILIYKLGVPFYFGGTSLLITVGVGLDTAQQIESHMLMRNYEGFLAKGRLKGRSG
jgi:preprotein translocase subunit SecY